MAGGAALADQMTESTVSTIAVPFNVCRLCLCDIVQVTMVLCFRNEKCNQKRARGKKRGGTLKLRKIHDENR